MKLANCSPFLVIVTLSIFGLACNNDGGGNDPSEACEDLCDRFGECFEEEFDEGECNDLCDEIDEGEDEVSDDCQDAIAELLDCIADRACEVLGEIDDVDDVESLIDLDVAGCGGELEDLIDECRDELEDE